MLLTALYCILLRYLDIKSFHVVPKKMTGFGKLKTNKQIERKQKLQKSENSLASQKRFF